MSGFWDLHLSLSEVARQLKVSRQNIHQRCLRKTIPCVREEGKVGIPKEWLEETLRLRARGSE